MTLKIWKNTETLDGFDEGLNFTENITEAEIAILGSKPIVLDSFNRLRAIFRAGIGRDNVPIMEAEQKGIIVRFPSNNTTNIIYDETAHFTCGLIFRTLYSNVGNLKHWSKEPRRQMQDKLLLVIGNGNIGSRVSQKMKPFLRVKTYDLISNQVSELKALISEADCISLHIPNSPENHSFFDKEKLSWMSDGSVIINTARGRIVDEDALFEEISSKRLKAAFDVFWEEPYRGKLSKYHPNNFFMTPHVASTCTGFLRGCRKDLEKLMADLNYA